MGVKSTIAHGTLLSGKYRIDRELGRGGMAAVYAAINVEIGKHVAIKLLAGHLAASQTVVERFVREARAVAKIRSPHICDIYDVGRLEDGTPYLVMELLEGESLYDAMVRDRQMSPHLTLAIILQVARGLQKAHQAQIVHRDLKPENIFLTVNDDGQLLVKVLDFGLAKFYDPTDATADGKHARLTREGAVFGTPAYMSPEQVRGQAKADQRADLWALACVTYECFTGTTVWSTEDGVAMTFAQIATAPVPSPRAYRPDLPEGFDTWFNTALSRDLPKRFQTVEEFADALVATFDYEDRDGLDISLVRDITRKAIAEDPAARVVDKKPGVDRRAAKVAKSDPAAPAPPVKKPSASPEPVALGRAVGISVPPAPQPRRAKLIASVLVGVLLLLAVLVLVKDDAATEVPQIERVAPAVALFRGLHPTREGGYKFVADHPWLPRLREAQSLVTKGELSRAEGMLQRLLDESRHGLARNLIDQVNVAKAAKASGAGCEVTGYARPRRYDLLDEDRQVVGATVPVMAHSIAGPVVAWADTRDGQRRAYAAPLDAALRNAGLSVDITPEGFRVGTPVLIPVADRLLTMYWDSGGTAPGVYLRWLGRDAVIAGSPVLVSQARPGSYTGDASRAGDGGFLVAWADRRGAGTVDLFFRRFASDAKPVGGAVHIGHYTSRGASRYYVGDVRIAGIGDDVHVAYALSQSSSRQIRYQKFPISSTGISAKDAVDDAVTLSKEVMVTDSTLAAHRPSLGCTTEGCFVAWNTLPKGGAGVAYIDGVSGKVQWHKRFALLGKNPVIGVSAKGDVRLLWVEGGRLTTAALGREGVGRRSVIARIVGAQPPPTIAAAGARDDWYVGWLDFESGHAEPYVARIACQR